jgi:hypothetical protein
MLVVVLIACCLGMSGCFFFDREHNRMHWEVIKRDLWLIHEDLDWILALDEESPLDSYYR